MFFFYETIQSFKNAIHKCRVINVLMKHPRDETRNSQKSNDTYDVIIGCASKINNFIKLGVLIFITDTSFITDLIL